jgi:hypothetical protein
MRIVNSLARILSAIIFIGILLLFALHVFVNIKGKELLSKKLKEAFGREVKMALIKTRLPFDLVINELEAKELFKVREIVAVGGVIDILRGNFTLSELRIKGAEVNIGRCHKAEPLQESQNTAASGQEPAVAKNSSSKNSAAAGTGQVGLALLETFNLPPVTIKHAIISDSSFYLCGRSVNNSPIRVTVKEVNIDIERLILPVSKSEITSFEITAKIPWENIKEEGKVWLEGWIDLFKKDMRAELKIEDIDAVYLHPYYANWMDLEKSHIQEAKLNFSSEVVGLNNEINADCHLELTSIVFKPREENQPQEKAERLAAAVIDIFKALNQGKIVLDFKFKTKMDSPEFGLSNIIKMAVQDKVKESRKSDTGSMAGKIVGGTILSAADLTKALINGTMSIGRELRKAIEGSFERQPREVPEAAVNQTVTEVNQTQ